MLIETSTVELKGTDILCRFNRVAYRYG